MSDDWIAMLSGIALVVAGTLAFRALFRRSADEDEVQA